MRRNAKPVPASAVWPITEPMVMEIDRAVYHVCEFGFDSLYVVVGDTRAALIDTGCGLVDLMALMS